MTLEKDDTYACAICGMLFLDCAGESAALTQYAQEFPEHTVQQAEMVCCVCIGHRRRSMALMPRDVMEKFREADRTIEPREDSRSEP
jgi:hypothetical protein